MKYLYNNQVVDIPDNIPVNTSVFRALPNQNAQATLGLQQAQPTQSPIPPAQNSLIPSPMTQTNPLQGPYQKAYANAPDEATRGVLAARYKAATGQDLFGTPQLNQQQQQLQQGLGSAVNDINLFKQNLNNTALKGGILGRLPAIPQFAPQASAFDAQRQSLAYSLASTLAQQRGQSLSDKDIKNFLSLLPSRADTPQSAQLKLNNIQQMLSNRGSQVGLNIPIPPNTSANNQNGGIGANAATDAKDILNGLLNIPAVAQANYQEVQAKMPGKVPSQTDLLFNIIQKVAPSILNEYNQAAGQPLQGGDVLGRIGQHAYQHPLNTALDVLPFIPALKALKGATATGDAATAVSDASKTGLIPKLATAGQKGAINTTEFLTGGGSKELIASNVNKTQPRTLAQTLLENGVTEAPSVRGQIQKTQLALNDVGKQLETKISASPVTLDTPTINTQVDQILAQNGVTDQAVATQIKAALAQQGAYNLGSNTSILTAKQVWDTAKNLDKFGKKAFNIPNIGPQTQSVSQDLSRYLRGYLAEKVPEATPQFRDYANLRDYMDNVLPDPSGLKAKGGISTANIIANLINASKGTLEFGSQKFYNLMDRLIPQITSEMQGTTSGSVPLPSTGIPYTPRLPLNSPLEGAAEYRKANPPKNRTIKYKVPMKNGYYNPPK